MERTQTKEQKHLLILSGPMGSGHVRAAKGLEEWARIQYPDLKITNINVEEYMTPLIKFIYVRLYIILNTRWPFLWGYVYHKTNMPPTRSLISRFLCWLRHFTGRKIVKEVLRLNADYIICTHYLPPELLNPLKKKGKLTVPVTSVVTDFSLHWIYIQPEMDHFCVASNELKFRLEKAGIPSEKIHETGIPVLPEFAKDYTEDEIAGFKEELGLPLDKEIIMLMMGGESKSKLEELSKLLLSHFDDLAFVVLPGKNKVAYENLLKMKEEFPDNLFPVSFTNDVWKYLAVSSTVISKPGGISTSECIAMRKPLIIMYPIPGQEERNADYLLERAVVSKAYDDISLLYKEVLMTDSRIEYMLQQIEYHRHPDAALKILEVGMGMDGNESSN